MTFDDANRWIKRNDIVRLRGALANGLDPNLPQKYGWTLLMLTAAIGDVAIGELLIDHGAELNSRNILNDTALSIAIQSGHPAFVSLLIRKGASKDCHPHGNSLADFFDWAEKYCSCSSASMRKIQRIFEGPELTNPNDESW